MRELLSIMRGWVRAVALAAALYSAAAAKRKRRERFFCEKRVGCESCVMNPNCLWCSSPRQCLDSSLSVEKLNESCPVQPPVPFCVDFNLEKEREGFVRPCARVPGGSMQPAELPPSCCGDGVCNAAEDAMTSE